MKYRSTRAKDGRADVSLSNAILSGLAPDGGLYVPVVMPKLDPSRLLPHVGDLPALASELLKPFAAGDVLEGELREMCEAAFTFEAPLRKFKNGPYVLELFHGPTAAFKDFGARFLAQVVSRVAESPIVLVATSGDTGGAVAAAFDRLEGCDVFVLFPENGVSRRQRHQLTCWSSNVHSFAVRGSFDDCQKMVKQAFLAWKGRRPLTSANSINIGRLLPQMVYYANASLAFSRAEPGAGPARFVIPTGNLGNAQAAIWAREAGLPIGALQLATNANRALAEFFGGRPWSPQPSIATLANAMDVGNPSNAERLFHLYEDPRAAELSACAVTDEEIRDEIRAADREWGEIIDPHTATAFRAMRMARDYGAIAVATAHPAKFETIVEPLIGRAVPLPESLRAIENRPERFATLGASSEELLAALAKVD
ncbi:MAG TPA: threonine synthase [Bdellovibrionales bacterium]|nr:threonine synthase [Bdellovibrionales bacterium]